MKQEKLERRIEKIRKYEEQIFNARLIVSACIFSLITAALFFSWQYLQIPLLITGAISFLILLAISEKLKLSRQKHEQLANLYKRIELRGNGQSPAKNYSWLSYVPKNLSQDAHILAQDLDLFGVHSLWSFICEAFSTPGYERMAQAFLSPFTEKDKILEMQKKVQMTSEISGWAKRFIILGRVFIDSLSDLNLLKSELSKSLFDSKMLRNLKIVFSLWGLAILETTIEFSTEFHPPLLFRLLFPLASLISLRSFGDSFSRSQSVLSLLEKWTPILSHMNKIEGQYRKLIPELSRRNPLKSIQRFEGILSLLTVNSHPLVALLINLLFPWNGYFLYRIEKIRIKLTDDISPLINEMAELELLTSLCLFKKYRKTVFPQIIEEKEIYASELLHPLGSPDFISNNVEFKNTNLILLTGSNMSGKSTFLRTLGLNQVLAQMGAPVCASEMKTFLAPLYTCIRISDSLRDGASYFYAEVRRLKTILEKGSTDRLIFLIDEIFRGTNNRERFLGAKELIKALVKTPSFGIITTHDLELTQLEADEIQNWHFSDLIQNEKLYFDYKLKKGPSPSTNALRIMEIEGLPTPSLK